MLVTHANMKGFGLTPLFGDRRGYMPPQLKTKTTFYKRPQGFESRILELAHLAIKVIHFGSDTFSNPIFHKVFKISHPSKL